MLRRFLRRLRRAWAGWCAGWRGEPAPTGREPLASVAPAEDEATRFRVEYRGTGTSGSYTTSSGADARRYWEAVQRMPGVLIAEFWDGDKRRGTWRRDG